MDFILLYSEQPHYDHLSLLILFFENSVMISSATALSCPVAEQAALIDHMHLVSIGNDIMFLSQNRNDIMFLTLANDKIFYIIIDPNRVSVSGNCA
ncbi:hypothetical protein SAMN04487897_1684 [Paenibacillus sp. yr247]|nr:hypothetical protein SAMN04487897_1684 [Paenibacillus sp. yr247]